MQKHLSGELPIGHDAVSFKQFSMVCYLLISLQAVVVSLNTLYDMNSFFINIANSMYIGVEKNL